MSTRTRVLEVSGSKVRETAALLGERLIRAVFVIEEPAEAIETRDNGPNREVEDVLREMDAHAVHAGEVDDSREAIYTRLEGE